MAVGSVVIDLLLKTGAFENDSKKAEKRLKEMAKTAKAAGVMIGTAITGAFLGITAAVKSSINSMDDMSKAALRAGASTEEFSKLAYAGDLADVSMETLTGSLGKLSKVMGQAMKAGSEQARIFEALGIDVIDPLTGAMRDSTDVLLDLADAYKISGDSSEFMAAGQKLLRGDFQALIPLIKDGSDGIRAAGDELERMGGVLSGQVGRDAEAFNDDLSRLTKQTGIFWQLVSADLLPDLNKLSAQFVDNATSAERLNGAATDLANMVRVLAGGFKVAYSVVDFFGNGIESLTQRVYGLYFAAKNVLSMNWSAVGDGLGLAFGGGDNRDPKAPKKAAPAVQIITGASLLEADKKALEAQVEAVKKAREMQAKLAAALGDTEKAQKSATKASKVAKEVISEEQRAREALLESYSSQQESMAREIALYGEVGRAAALRYDIERDGLEKIDPLRAKALQEQAQWLDFLDEQAVVEGVWADGHQENTNRMIEGWAGAADAMSVYAEQAGRNMQDAFADFLFDPFEDGLKGLVENFAKALQRMAAEAAAAKIFESLGKTGEANGGTWWGGLLSSFFGGGKASGGSVSAGRTYLVGERGPELLQMGGGSGNITPNNRLDMGGGGNVTVNIHNAPGGADVKSKRNDSGGFDIDVIFKQIESGIAGNMAGGASPINRSIEGRYNMRPAV